MGFMDAMKRGFGQLKAGLDAEIAKLNSKDAVHASLAIVALVAGADGEIEPQEKKAGADFVRNGELFKAFDRATLASTLDGFYAKATSDILKGDLFDVVAKVKGTDAARSVVKVGMAIAFADGELEAGEKEVMVEVCQVLGIEPTSIRGLS